ncbi:zf-DHHC-domain-containing protein [Lepidopterella palustris CBS 459.81]|uniref:Palmitoyltransferase PFA4 n=1 Tax=Lepidopterella palustris CBS 459.81 TaxID=1314670 RepID=A0A8E2JCV2_9PEZI|nr:zf-DHHC-domain-containing protein [Lepidopterella palustris CBS 459.81]
MQFPSVASFAVPSVFVLISFLAYSSQWLFLYLEPHPLGQRQSAIFNVLVVCLIICYVRAVRTDPGRIPKVALDLRDEVSDPEKLGKVSIGASRGRQRWCRKCEAVKPPRAHHCKVCKRCIPKMDHHCPWTANCVSHTTFPHFIRFLFYAVAAMSYLAYFIFIRCSILYENRNLPSYLGPSLPQFVLLFLLIFGNSITLFALSILLIRNIWCLGANTTTIEGWEIERHKALVRRARYFGGFLNGPDGVRVRIERQEFPYDIGIWQNFKQGMGTGNIFAWFWPFSASPRMDTGLEFEVNGFEDTSVSWPPPDPDRMHRKVPHGFDREEAFTQPGPDLTAEQNIAAFKQRQQVDIQRWKTSASSIKRRKPFVKRMEDTDGSLEYGSDGSEVEDAEDSGEEGWKNSEGERLRDFGVDEEVEFYDDEDDDIPLSELMRKRKAGRGAQSR